MAKTGSILLNLIPALSPKKREDILSVLTDPQAILEADAKTLRGIPSLTQKDIDEILHIRSSGLLEKEFALIAHKKIHVIDIFDAHYPKLLKEISHPPLILYIKGNVDILNEFLFAIVGTRIPTIYGITMAEEFSYTLASLGMIIVSGLARGIDTAAHKGALKCGKTIAVLGSGLCNIYPKENTQLSERIADTGALISEFPMNEPPRQENFPRRNRIVSGLSKGVLVVEAAQRSGALITAHYALEQNREVFAIPGKADSPLSQGTHSLIKEGAKLVDAAKDILEELHVSFDTKKTNDHTLSLPKEEQAVFSLLDKEGAHLEEIIQKCHLEQSLVNKIILNLQLKGVVKEVKPSYFVRT
ncbi:MAG: DNA-processing protein DprA [Candidatus Omnitrophota bacterium]